ncbi:MAG TPA: hypothetical protein P5234_15300 [Thermoanaerobaculaceae bacterium]|nr:hypothetical protein [Thermoanaerobaculaceae bacterium]HRS17601.1 hypothetical protein [Thermoanaerobaculaceae bacterium]
MRRFAVLFALFAATTPAPAQTVSESRTSSGLPVVVVELPGGDLEHLVAVVPLDARPVERVADLSVQVTPLRLAQVVAVRAGELQLAAVARELLAGLRDTGAAAVVAVGPRPAREMSFLVTGAEDVPWRPLPRQRCPRVDGGLEALSGSPERLELALSLPEPTDVRLGAASALALWIELAVRGRVPGVRAAIDLSTGCARLILRAPAEHASPRAVLRTLRGELATLASRVPSPQELEAVLSASAARAGRLAVDTAGVARDLAEWVALGGVPSVLLSSGEADVTAISSLAGEVLAGHSGWGKVVEAERWSRPPARESLENSAILSVAWVPGELAVVGLALGGFSPRTGAEVLDRAAGAAADQGWATHRTEILGVPAVAVAVPAAACNEALELLVGSVQAAEAGDDEPLWGEAARALGLAAHPHAETVSLAAVLPLEAEEAAEAARKFLAGLPTGSVRVETPERQRRLQWTPSEGAPKLVAVVEIEGSTAGAMAALVLQSRAAAAGLEARVLAPTGRLALGLAGSGEAHVPALDARLASAWPRLVRPVDGAELKALQARAGTVFLGDMAHAVARFAAQPFLAAELEERAWRAATAGEVNVVLGALPGWTGLLRFAQGVAPPSGKDVRQSAPGAPPER